MSDSSKQMSPQPVAARSAGAWLAYLLLIAILAISVFAIWLVLKACGFQLFGRTVVFYWCQEPPTIVRDLTELEDRNRLLRNQIHDTQLALMTPEACGPVVDLTPEPEPVLAPDPVPVQDPVPVPEPVEEEQQEPEPVEAAAYQCEPDEVLQQPIEVAIVLDGSGSMQYSVDIPELLERQYLDASNAASNAGSGGDFIGILNRMELQERANALDRQLREYPGSSRMEIAREVLDQAVRQTPSNIKFDLTYFNSCTSITAISFGSDRDGLRRAISRVSPNSGTPLAQSMRISANNLEGGGTEDDPVNMVIVTDGDDSCGGDPCAAARELKMLKPGLIINVVDMSQSNVLSCVSNATGGTYRRSRGGGDSGELVTAVQEAAGYSGEGQCRPATSK